MPNTTPYKIICVLCDTEWNETETCTTCKKCGGALDVHMDIESIGRNLNRFSLSHTPLSAAKYLDFYPLKDRSKVVSLSEGDTPLYHGKKLGKKLGVKNLYIKNEGVNPTGVFKDRGSLVEITKALELGAKSVCVASTGNMAASVSAYSSQAGLPCYIFVPEGTPIGKLSQTLSYGGKLIQIRGTYADCVQMAEKFSVKHNAYLAGDYAFRAEGAKSTSFEIIEQLHWKSPDTVIVPVGCGTNLAGIWKGFYEFHKLGFIDKVPKIIGVQPNGCDTICTAFVNNDERYTYVEKPNTIASAVGIGVPQDDVKCLHAIRSSEGDVATASDEDILDAQKMLAGIESIFVEPSGAIPVAVIPNLLKRNIISSDDTIVCIATGTGLKDPKTALGSFSEPTSLDPNIEAVEEFLKSGSPVITKRGSEDILFTINPEISELQKILKEHFGYTPGEEIIEKIQKEVSVFLRRGKNVKEGDLLSIVEEVIENVNAPKTPLKLIDFSIQAGYRKNPDGKITIQFEEKKITEQAKGVGPVDALISALKKGVSQETNFWPILSNFHVDVTSSEENAVVKVKMEMKDKKENKVTASTSSPDIIVASLLSFIKGYNLLYSKK